MSEAAASKNAPTSGVHAPEWIRMPRNGDSCAVTSLTRGMLYNLCVPCPANGWNPPVRHKDNPKWLATFHNKQTGTKRGARLVHLPSLIAYFEQNAAEEAEAARLKALEHEEAGKKAA